ncbi:MAG UNVERIFIED_CONTAM: hypothetical protein LVQ98_03220 [Rickettsiaceae bacterium]|jgi:hypothetical protein
MHPDQKKFSQKALYNTTKSALKAGGAEALSLSNSTDANTEHPLFTDVAAE